MTSHCYQNFKFFGSRRPLREASRPSPTVGWGWCGSNCFASARGGREEDAIEAANAQGHLRIAKLEVTFVQTGQKK